MNSGDHAMYQRPSLLRRFFSFLLMVAVVVGVSIGLRTFVVEPFQIPSGSMEKTIMTGDMVFAEKVSYQVGEPKAGDIAVFSDPQVSSRVLIKRIVATEGQTIDLRNGKVYVDGVQLSEDYAIGNSEPLPGVNGKRISYPYTIPDGYVWVMGDNREHSSDSRYFGPISRKDVIARAAVVYWPIDHMAML